MWVEHVLRSWVGGGVGVGGLCVKDLVWMEHVEELIYK